MAKIRRIEPTIPELPKLLKVAAYARVSRDTERLMHSVSAQISYYSNLIQKTPGWEYAGVYADSGISGTGIESRAEFKRLISDCDAGKIDIVLTKSISRFARNTVDLLSTVRHLKELGVEVRFEKERISSFSGDGELMMTIIASFAQEESRSTSENCKWGIRKRFQSGEIGVANKHIFGYQYDDELKKYVIIPDEAEGVRLMFDLYLKGSPLRTIADTLNNSGYQTILGNKFSEGNVDALIHNEIYSGDLLRQKSFIPDPISGRKIKNRGQLPQYHIKDCHEAILNRETYEKVKQEIERRASMVNPTYPFTGKIVCGICGKPFSRNKSSNKGKTYTRWICRSRKDPGPNCGSSTYSEKELEKITTEMLGIGSFDEDAFDYSIKKMTVLDDGSIRFDFQDKTSKVWIKPPKPPKIIRPALPKKPANVFDRKIYCGMCGRRYGRSVNHIAKGDALIWRCRTKSGHDMTCDSVNYPDETLRKILCDVLKMPAFDEELFSETAERIVIQQSGSIDVHLKDGQIKTYKTLRLRNNIHETSLTEELNGKIWCECCGNPYIKYACRDKYVYWHCQGKISSNRGCKSGNFADSDLRKIIAFMLDIDDFDPEIFLSRVKTITALSAGGLRFLFTDGASKEWFPD